MWDECLAAKSREMWRHDGSCPCGKRTYLFGQCGKCMRADAVIRDQQIEQAVADVEQAELEEEDNFPTVNSTTLIPQIGMPGVSRGYKTSEVIFITKHWLRDIEGKIREELDLAARHSSHMMSPNPSLTSALQMANTSLSKS